MGGISPCCTLTSSLKAREREHLCKCTTRLRMCDSETREGTNIERPVRATCIPPVLVTLEKGCGKMEDDSRDLVRK